MSLRSEFADFFNTQKETIMPKKSPDDMLNTSCPGLIYIGIIFLNNPVPAYHAKYYCNNRNHKQDVNDVTHSEACKTKIAD